ncbi:dipeptidase [Acrocarpospora catenulata]|uniref:dipeptidase n=1 Tax=Acrocarpospora catenulata TaxID=2836182 RepID=UPI001BDA4DA5|nr:membrane dipeptidase [Acrocarpospora catenulata]
MVDPRSTLTIDATCPPDVWRSRYPEWIEGGFSACVVTAGGGSTLSALTGVAETLRIIESDDRLLLAETADDLRTAHESGRLGVVLQFQSPVPFGYEISNVTVFHKLGLRMVGLAYNRRNPIGDGCEEPSDAGLSTLGRQVVAEMTRLGMLVDFAHTGWRTCADALAHAGGPCIASHSNAHAVHAHPRNLPDEILRGIAASGGVIGMNGFPAFVSAARQSTLDQFIDHIVHIDSLVGGGHVGLGLDYSTITQGEYDEMIAGGDWSADNYPPPPWLYPQEIESPRTISALADRLSERGYADDEIRGVLGENWMRLFERVWAA